MSVALNVAVYLFDRIEVLDFAGPFEVFSTASRMISRGHASGRRSFDVFTISETGEAITARGGLRVIPTHSIDHHPKIDILVIPGGDVTEQLDRPAVISWIASQSHGSLVASICTGAFLLGKAKLLDGKSATTHWEDIESMRHMFPAVQVREGVRYVDEEKILTSAGISAGIDMSLHIVGRCAGEELAVSTARQMEYDWSPRGPGAVSR